MFNMYGFLYKSFNNEKIKQARDKLNNGNLSIQNVLEDNDLVNSFKVTSVCQLQDFLTKDNLLQLIHFSTTYPEIDDLNIGRKYPFNACEILSCDNQRVMERFFEIDKKKEKTEYVFKDEEDDEVKIDKYYFNEENGAMPDKIEKPLIEEQEKADEKQKMDSSSNLYIEDDGIRYPLLDRLFNFLKPDTELDHVLCGYFAKIFNSLFLNKGGQLIKYLFERNDIILSMVKHSNRISIVECLVKLIKYDTDSIIVLNKSCDEVKEEVFKELFDFIDNNLLYINDEPDPEILQSLSAFFQECIDDTRTLTFFIKCPKFSLKLFETFLNPHFANKLHLITKYLEKVYEELTYKENNTPNNTFNQNAQKLKLDIKPKDEDISSECYYFLELFNSMIDYLFSRFKDENYGLSNIHSEREFDNSTMDKQKKLGLPKIYIMNLTHQILKHAFYVYDKRYFHYEEDFFIEFYNKIILSEFFSISAKYFLEFPWNNIYQNSFLTLLIEILKFPNINSILYEHIFYEIGFLEELILCVIDEKYCCLSKFQFSKAEIQAGFLPFIIEIAFQVHMTSYNSDVLKDIISKTNKFGIFFTYFVEPAKIRFLTGLCQEKKEQKDNQENDILYYCDHKVFNHIYQRVSISLC